MWVPLDAGGFLNRDLNHDKADVRVLKQWNYWCQKYKLVDWEQVGDQGRKSARCVTDRRERAKIRPAKNPYLVFRISPHGILFIEAGKKDASGRYELLCPIPQTEEEFKMMLFLAKI